VKYTTRSRRRYGQFAEVSIIVEPNEPGKGYEFESKIVGGAVRRNTSPASKRASTA